MTDRTHQASPVTFMPIFLTIRASKRLVKKEVKHNLNYHCHDCSSPTHRHAGFGTRGIGFVWTVLLLRYGTQPILDRLEQQWIEVPIFPRGYFDDYKGTGSVKD